MLNIKNATVIMTLLAVSACGGADTIGGLGAGSFSFSGSSAATSVAGPTASSGYSQSGQSSLLTDVTYDLNSGFLNNYANNTDTLVVSDATFHTTSTGGVLTINGNTYTMTFVSGSALANLEGSSGGNTAVTNIYDTGDHAYITYVSETDGSTYLLDGYAIMGANTDPANVPTSGTAVGYYGNLYGYANYGNNTYDGISGPVSLTANFQSSTISGSGSFTDDDGIVLGAFEVPSTQIVGNTFETVPNIILTTPGSSISGAQITGDFYGPSGEEVAGTFAATGTTVIGDMTIQGAFVAAN